ncbi:protease m1 zinc metalloprotease [Holotrichia oblita]|uniref:Protease m1 zinc metalloprotease n=1 Tax=Holotrichia oblita TaxID=644536 RepID=A0ACB9SWN7_HOLOL|nr:protease m1 zinc metalloprotease [Holotrichia oblita]
MASKFGRIFTIIVISYLVSQVTCHSKRSIDLIAAHSLISDTRLPKEISPNSYKVKVQPFPEEGYFKGEVRINVTWQESTDLITLHAHNELEISEKDIAVIQFMADDESEKLSSSPMLPSPIKLIKIERVPKKPLIVLHMEKPLNRGSQCEIQLGFAGKMYNDTSEALFRHQYIDTVSGEKKWYVATHFRPNLARRVFPCFDEPALKATFLVSVARQKHMTALSNMPLINSEEIGNQPGWVWDHFEQTPVMSTFTVGFVVSEFVYVERNKTEDDKDMGLDIKVWSRPDYLDMLKNVSDKIIRSLEILQDFWGVPYPLPKLDCFALPNYQATKPADNWGLILFKESELTSKKTWHISQELVYQWLGSLATPFWWSDAHINNALNRYVTAYTTLELNYGYETFNNWPTTMLYSIYYEFSKRYPHGKTTAIKQDSVSAKTELVFRMLNYTLGESTFKHGLQKFMTDRQYKTFFGDDIWAALNDQANFDSVLPKDATVNAIAASWITKDRLPVINVVRNYADNTVNITQKVYLRERPHDVPDQDKLLWWIPIVLVKQNKLDFKNTTPAIWMQKEKTVTLTDMPGSDFFIIVNPEEIGPFPVNYDQQNWNMLSNFLIHDKDRLKIPVNTRAKLLHDAWNLAYAGDLCFDTALDMTLFLKHEKEYIAWDPIFTMIDHIGRHIDSPEIHRKFQIYIRDILEPLYIELASESKEGESDGKAHLRSTSKTFLCQAGYKPCIEEAQAAFKKWMDSENPDEGNPVANQYICPVFQWGTKEEWEFGLQRIINFPPSRKQNERTYLLKTLAGCPLDSWKIERLLNITVLETNGNFSDNDVSLIFSMLAGRARGYTTLFNFLEKNWFTIKTK